MWPSAPSLPGTGSSLFPAGDSAPLAISASPTVWRSAPWRARWQASGPPPGGSGWAERLLPWGELVAEVAGDGYALAAGRVGQLAMAAEAAGPRGVAHVVGVGLPGYPHLGEGGEPGNLLQLLQGPGHGLLLLIIELRGRGPVELLYTLHPLEGFREAGRGGHQGLESFPLDKGEAGVHGPLGQGRIYELRRGAEDMGGPVMAVNAVHKALPLLYHLGRHFVLLAGVVVLSEVSPGPLHPHPAYFLAFLIQGEIPELGRHVPVDAAGFGGPRPTHLQCQSHILPGVSLVLGKAGPRSQHIPGEFLGPVADLAGLPGGTQLLHRGGDGAVVGIQQHGKDL